MSTAGASPSSGERQKYNDWHSGIENEPQSRPPWRVLFSEHIDFGKQLRGQRIVEVGCGRGDGALELASETGEWLGAGDFALSAVARGREKQRALALPPRISWYCADAAALPIADASIDWLLCFEVVEHLPQPGWAVREFARVLRPGGHLVLTTPNYLNASGLYRFYLRLRGRRFAEAGQPINRLTSIPRTRWWLWRAGLRVVAFDGMSHFLPVAPGRPALELRFLDRHRTWTKWFAIQTFFLAQKVSGLPRWGSRS